MTYLARLILMTRSLWGLDLAVDWPEYRDRRRKCLSDIIKAILCRNPALYYFQGLHDIISVLFVVLRDDGLSFQLAERICPIFFSDFMKPNFDSVAQSLSLISPLIRVADKELYSHLHMAGIEPFFATAWVVTWFAHDLEDSRLIARTYDALICSHPLFSLYLSVAVS
jgi:hypothetical protein